MWNCLHLCQDAIFFEQQSDAGLCELGIKLWLSNAANTCSELGVFFKYMKEFISFHTWHFCQILVGDVLFLTLIIYACFSQ